MIWQLRALAAPPEAPSLVSSTHTGWFITFCNSSSRESDAFSGFQNISIFITHTYMSIHTHAPIEVDTF